MSKVTILITAAAGTSSNATARHLLALADHSKYRILVGARSDTKIKDLIQKGAEYVQFDFNDKKRVEEGLKGVDYLWVTIPNPSKDGPVINMPHLIADFMDQVKQSDVKQIVFGTIDSSIVDPNHKYIMPSEFRLVENKIRSLNIPATYIHMGWFQENVVTYHAEELKDGVYVEPIGNSVYNQVSVEDIGEAAATVLLNPKDHVGKTYGITGPRALGGEELAKILSEVLQRPIQFVNPSPEEMEKVLLTMMPPQLATAALQLYEIIRLGLMAQVSDDYIKLTGKQYTTIEDRYKQLKASGLLQ